MIDKIYFIWKKKTNKKYSSFNQSLIFNQVKIYTDRYTVTITVTVTIHHCIHHELNLQLTNHCDKKILRVVSSISSYILPSAQLPCKVIPMMAQVIWICKNEQKHKLFVFVSEII